jgi:pimeloyl-ACP methyl ester carboxylesterase
MPVLAIGGEASYGALVGQSMSAIAADLQSVIIAGAGHWVAERAPDALLAELTTFLAPFRDGEGAAQYAVAASGSPR